MAAIGRPSAPHSQLQPLPQKPIACIKALPPIALKVYYSQALQQAIQRRLALGAAYQSDQLAVES